MKLCQKIILHVDGCREIGGVVEESVLSSVKNCDIIRYSDLDRKSRYLNPPTEYSRFGRNTLPDLILISLGQHDWLSFTLLNKIRNSPEWAHIPIVAIGRRRDNEYVSDLYRLGCNSYVTLPDSHEEQVIKLVETAMFWTITAEVPDCAEQSDILPMDSALRLN